MIARGSYQQMIFDTLRDGYPQSSPSYHIRGKAKNYLGRYIRSFQNLLVRMERAGYVISRESGIRGGEWGATYRVVARDMEKVG